MRKFSTFCLSLLFSQLIFSQNPTAKLKAFQKQNDNSAAMNKDENLPDYYIYLISNDVSFFRLERVWINKELYHAGISRVTDKPVIVTTDSKTDTLVRYTDEDVWQISIKAKAGDKFKPIKAIADLVAQNELVLRLYDRNGKLHTRQVERITRLN